jgi:hypothetical protein
MESTSFAYTPGDVLYVGPSGTLTAVDPATDSSAKYIQRIGTALSSTVVQIDIGQASVKEA